MRPSKKTGYIGIDSISYPGDLCGDVFEILKLIPDESCESIYASHFFCHINNWEKLLQECARILTSSGQLEIINPHFSNPYFFSDPTHVKTSGLYSFSYYARDKIHYRKVPLYKNTGFTIQKIYLCFKASKPFYLSYGFGILLSKIINLSTFIREFYEWHLTKLFSCYEIRFVLIKRQINWLMHFLLNILKRVQAQE